MKTIERFKEYLESKGITNAQAERDCGFSNGLIGNAYKTKTAIGSDKLEKILNTYADLSAEWLIRGNGSMIIGRSRIKDIEDKIQAICLSHEQVDMAYDIVLSMLDTISKTYNFMKIKSI